MAYDNTEHENPRSLRHKQEHEQLERQEQAVHEHHSHAHDAAHAHGQAHEHLKDGWLKGDHLLEVRNLSVGFEMYDPEAESFFNAQQKVFQVIDDLSISVRHGEIVAVVGASGSGKTLLADAIMGLFEPNALIKGAISFNGVPRDAHALLHLRGAGISLVPQSVSHLDPLMRVGKQVEGLSLTKEEAEERAKRRAELFKRYELDESVARMDPHELSGGMARRVLLCCALMDDPQLIIADEPTPGLDLPLAVAALQDFRAFANEGGGVLLITHDIELALQVADRVAVFNDGTVVEETDVANFASPETLEHPFSKALWHALPGHDFFVEEGVHA